MSDVLWVLNRLVMVVLLLLMLFVSFIENMLVFECCIERGVEK